MAYIASFIQYLNNFTIISHSSFEFASCSILCWCRLQLLHWLQFCCFAIFAVSPHIKRPGRHVFACAWNAWDFILFNQPSIPELSSCVRVEMECRRDQSRRICTRYSAQFRNCLNAFNSRRSDWSKSFLSGECVMQSASEWTQKHNVRVCVKACAARFALIAHYAVKPFHIISSALNNGTRSSAQLNRWKLSQIKSTSNARAEFVRACRDGVPSRSIPSHQHAIFSAIPHRYECN